MALVAVAALPAGAASAPDAFVRVEGARTTLVAQRLVRTQSGDRVKGNACSETSAAAALDDATHGKWSGSYSTKFGDYLVSSIDGEAPTGNNFWTLFVNGRASSTGACETPLHSGDHVLWFDCQADANFNCTNDPLAVTVPTAVQRGRRITAHVTQIDGAGHSKPMGGARVGGAMTDASGVAHLTLHSAGTITLQARRSGATPSDPVPVCVYVHRRSECGSADRGPVVHVAGISEHETFTRAHAPRELDGTAGPDPSGLTDVSFSVHRRASNGRCSYYDADRAAFLATGCGPAAPLFSLGASAKWSYLLPKALAPGRYVLEVIATDGANRHTKLVTGRQPDRLHGAMRTRAALTTLLAVVASLAAATATVGTTATAAAKPATATVAKPATVEMMVIGKTRTVMVARSVVLKANAITIGHRRCNVAAGTALAGLVDARLKPRVTNAAGCDPASMFVTKIGSDANHGIAGWEYKVGHTSPSPGAGDPGGRLRAGQQLLWFWCTRASACQRTLGLSVSGNRLSAVTRVTVSGYDDNGHGTRIAGATVHVDSTTAVTGADGTATVLVAPGRHTVYATKTGLVQSFPTVVTR